MPYSDPDAKREWDKTHRPDKLQRLKEAAAWADSQIKLLNTISPREQTRKELRKALVSQFLRTHYSDIEVFHRVEAEGWESKPPDP